mmetsp:Transcript_12984/g.24403  ORF Transcript_12984/g.24403 Transcript_12984/m.24403 type:complete len:559 (+) Transcript_12984:81-1757(+)
MAQLSFLVKLLFALIPYYCSQVAMMVVAIDTTTTSSIPTVSSIENGLTYDENGRLASYYLVFPSSNIPKNCPAVKTNRYGIQLVALEGEALDMVFPGYVNDENDDNDDSPCVAACLERGAERTVAGYAMPDKLYNASNSNNVPFEDWFVDNCAAVEVCLMNYVDEEYELENYWIPFTGEREPTLGQVLKYGEKNTKCFTSYLGHKFQVKNAREGSIVANYTVEFPMTLGFGQNPRHKETIQPGQFDSTIKSTLKAEWNKKSIPQRTFSSLGFAKGRLPNDVYAAMGAFYYNNRNYKQIEEWKGKGVFVNWWESDVFFIQIPWQMKDKWQHRLVDIVSAWVGLPVEQTVMYGLRQYETGARLLTHVDRLRTHVVSLIVNVAQGNLSEEWPVEVFDHYGRLHEVVMQPGDIVYYESAKNLHSRNRPLTGENAYYVNLFTHYRPVGEGDEWYKLPTSKGSEPVLEAEGECHVPPQVVSRETEHLGYGKVKCDDARLGRNISPSLFVAKSHEDLIQWWERTAPSGMMTRDGNNNNDMEESDNVQQEYVDDNVEYVDDGNDEL